MLCPSCTKLKKRGNELRFEKDNARLDIAFFENLNDIVLTGALSEKLVNFWMRNGLPLKKSKEEITKISELTWSITQTLLLQ